TANSSAALPFTLESGMIYQLTAEFTMGAIDTANTAWCGISFCTSGDELEHAPDKNSFSRFYAQLNGDVTAVSDSSTKRQRLYTGGDVTLSIILNTIGTEWSMHYFLNNSLYTSSTVTAAAAPGSELYIKFGHYRQVGEATINNFTFETIPEPPHNVYCLFACGGELKHHRHYDALSFTIYSDDSFLALDSGDRSGEVEKNRDHILNYYIQSVAHNTILVHQTNEPTTTYWGKASVMDGGQHNFTGSRLEAFETNASYTYVAGDATGCYFHGGGGDLPEKVSLVTRQMVFLRPNYFVIFDRVNSIRSEYPKTWLLHTVNQPQLKEDIFYADHENRRLFCRTLLPVNSIISTVGGAGREFWSAGRNWPLPFTDEEMAEAIHDTAGRWRVEVQPSTQQLNDCFLHVLQVTDQNIGEMTMTELLQIQDFYGVTLTADGSQWDIYFNRTGALGGKISCKGKINFTRDFRQDIQMQSGIIPEKTQLLFIFGKKLSLPET
ncbi:MAG: heparinase II/III family protein, partial [Kiritimatiellales bacterium]